jgi:hypothetical protein
MGGWLLSSLEVSGWVKTRVLFLLRQCRVAAGNGLSGNGLGTTIKYL